MTRRSGFPGKPDLRKDLNCRSGFPRETKSTGQRNPSAGLLSPGKLDLQNVRCPKKLIFIKLATWSKNRWTNCPWCVRSRTIAVSVLLCFIKDARIAPLRSSDPKVTYSATPVASNGGPLKARLYHFFTPNTISET